MEHVMGRTIMLGRVLWRTGLRKDGARIAREKPQAAAPASEIHETSDKYVRKVSKTKQQQQQQQYLFITRLALQKAQAQILQVTTGLSRWITEHWSGICVAGLGLPLSSLRKALGAKRERKKLWRQTYDVAPEFAQGSRKGFKRKPSSRNRI